MRIYISGSLAFDRIMDFPGKFSDHILPDKIHILNVCFMVNGLAEKYGGTAGNIAYNLALLGERPIILATSGKDFGEYEEWLTKNALSLEGVRRVEDEPTACAYITTDQSDNQITGFNPGAMKHPSLYDFDRAPAGQALAIVSPGNLDDMKDYCRTYRERNIPYIFDPGQAIPAFSGDQMVEMLTGSMALVSNDYELEMIMKATSLDMDALLERTGAVVTTLGEQGSRVVRQDRETDIPPVQANPAKDPTGAGDAFRAGLLKGLRQGKSLEESARLGSACAVYCVERYGTQEHAFTMDEFMERYRDHFGPDESDAA
jgi:adenosine kinase